MIKKVSLFTGGPIPRGVRHLQVMKWAGMKQTGMTYSLLLYALGKFGADKGDNVIKIRISIYRRASIERRPRPSSA